MATQRISFGTRAIGADAVEERILAQRADLLDAALPLAIVAVVLNGAVLGWLLLDRVPEAQLACWAGLVIVVSLFRWMIHLHLRRRRGRVDTRTRLRWAVAGALLSAATWGLAALLLFPPGDAVGQAVLTVVLAGVTSGAANTLAVFLGLAWAFLGMTLVPLIYRLFSAGSELGIAVGVLASLYLVLMSVIAARYHRTIVDSLRMRHAHAQAEATIAQQAFYDSLTGLPNRRLLLDRLGQLIARGRGQGFSGAVLLLDIDRFKGVNDSLGHAVGDGVLHIIAERLSRGLSGEDSAARLGGDEFVVVLAPLCTDADTTAHRARLAAERLAAELAAPCRPHGSEVHVTASIGIALFPGDAAEPEPLLRAAETAMNRAKEAGRDTIRFFLPHMQAAAVARMQMERALRHALRDRELVLHLQPQVDGSGSIVAAEALLRWPRGTAMVAAPDVFVPVAEDCGLIHALGDWVFDEALSIIQRIRRHQGLKLARIAVNVSPEQFRRTDFVAMLTRRLVERGVDPRALELELTEGTVVADFNDTARKMDALRRIGVHFSIDDFGTGWSSLTYLKRLPLDALKIDRSFIHDLAHDESDAAIVDAIIEMAHRLGLMVVAEGVDHPSTHAFLAARGCDRYQGNLLHPPMPLEHIVERFARTPPSAGAPPLAAG